MRTKRKIILWGLLASFQHLAVQGNQLVPDSMLCLPFFISLSCVLVSEASLMSCMKKDWESPQLPAWNNGLYLFTRKLRDVMISDSSTFVLVGKLCCCWTDGNWDISALWKKFWAQSAIYAEHDRNYRNMRKGMESPEGLTCICGTKTYEWRRKQKLTVKNGRKCNLIEIQNKILFMLNMDYRGLY